MKYGFGLVLLLAQVLCAADYPPGPGKWNYPGLWLKVTDEVAPAGGVAQIQIVLTEPKPIIRTRMYLEFDESVVEDITSLTIFSESGEAMGTAIRKGNLVTIEAVSPTGELGNSDEYPVFTATVRLKASAEPGAKAAFRILPESMFLDANSADWVITSNEPGSLTVDGSLSIEDVVPGAGVVRAGQPIRILGSGFRAWSTVEIYDAPAMKVTYVSPKELVVTLAEDFQIDQRKVEVINPDRSERAFYTHARGAEASGSMYDLLSATKMMFSHKTWSQAGISMPDAVAEEVNFAGIALQNPGLEPVVVRLSVGEFATSVTLLPLEKLVRSMDELFPEWKAKPGETLRVDASSPVQILGLLGESTSGTVLPLAIAGE
ncbi:MAG: hypothetical protein IPP47_28805 [Bryobacterales bacterium]|nr:hypothetical protein [Bryobacterales bacterium]